MNVKLVSITKSLIEEKELTSEELITYIARVSNPANQLNSETSDKLISYLIRNKHWSPFEMVDMTVEIVTSRAIAQQILRHRSFSFQEFSQRYSKVNEVEDVQLRYQADKNRQSSTVNINDDDKQYFDDKIEEINKLTRDVYNEMITKNIAKECARFILSLSTQTRIYMKGSIRSWIHYLHIRCDNHTQLEHRQIAEKTLGIFNKHFPNIAEALTLRF